MGKDKEPDVEVKAPPPPAAAATVVATLKEIIVFRDPPVIHIYNVVEHGRRW